MDKAHLESGRELLELYDDVNTNDAPNPALDDIIDMVDIDGSGAISWDELKTTLEANAKLFDYTIDKEDKGELEFMWKMMDVNGDESLDPSEVKKVLESTPLT